MLIVQKYLKHFVELQSSPWVSLAQAERPRRAALCTVGSPFAACRQDFGLRPEWRRRPRSSGSRRSTGWPAPRSWRLAGPAVSGQELLPLLTPTCLDSWLEEKQTQTMSWRNLQDEVFGQHGAKTINFGINSKILE